MTEMPQNIADTILEQATREADHKVHDLAAHDGTSVAALIARAGMSATVLQSNLDAFAAVPRSRAGKIRALDLDSFASLILRDYDHGSVIFADVSGAGVQFECVLDYHHIQGDPAAPKRTGQRHGREVVFYDPALSDEWQAWTKQSKQPMSQTAFAEWIDDRLPDIADPQHLLAIDQAESTAAKFGAVYGGSKENLFGYASPERMIKLSTGLSVRESSVVKGFVNLASGEVQAQYETTHTDAENQPLNIPRRFLLSIPVFRREAAYLVPVKLQYRKKGGSIEWTFEMVRPDRFRDDAIEGMRTALAAKLTPALATGAERAPVVPIHLAKRTAQG